MRIEHLTVQETLQRIIKRGLGSGEDSAAALCGQTVRLTWSSQHRAVSAGDELQLWTSGHGAEEKPAGAVVALCDQVHSSGAWDKHSEQQHSVRDRWTGTTEDCRVWKFKANTWRARTEQGAAHQEAKHAPPEVPICQGKLTPR